MAIKGFDYKGLAKNLAEQAKNLAPEDLCDSAKEYLVKTLENFTLLSGEALYNDSSIKLNAEQAQLITQIISEWTFHKCVDLARSGIDSQYWDEVMQKVAFTAFEVTKQATLRKLPQEQIVQAAEYHVVKAYNEAIDELYNDNKITEEIVEMAKSQSNIDKLAEEAETNEKPCNESEIIETEEKKSSLIAWLKDNVSIVALLIILIAFGVTLYFFKPSEALLSISTAILYFVPIITRLTKKYKHAFITMIIVPCIVIINSILMHVFHYNHAGWFLLSSLILLFYGFSILVKKDVEEQLQELENVKNKMEYMISPDCMYEERFEIDIITITVGSGLLLIADPDQDGELVPRLAALRQRLTDEYGYVIPEVRVKDSKELDEYEYTIKVRDKAVASEVGSVDEISNAVDVIINELEECVIKYVDKIMTDTDVEKLLEIARKESDSRIEYLLEHLSVYDIKNIFTNLIREKVSIKDINFITMKLCEYLNEQVDVKEFAEKLKADLEW